MQLAEPFCPEHIVLSKTQLLAMPGGLPTEEPGQHAVQVRPRALLQGRHFCKVAGKGIQAQ